MDGSALGLRIHGDVTACLDGQNPDNAAGKYHNKCATFSPKLRYHAQHGVETHRANADHRFVGRIAHRRV